MDDEIRYAARIPVDDYDKYGYRRMEFFKVENFDRFV